MNNHIQDSIKIPQIYVYTTDTYSKREWQGSRNGCGVLKIGFTNRVDASRRIDEQWPIKLPDEMRYELLWKIIAIDDQGKVFSDKYLHKYLENEKGFTKVNNSEWFECTLDEVKSSVFEIIKSEQYSRPRQLNFKPRPEQLSAIEQTSNYFLSYPGRLVNHMVLNP